MSAHPKHSTASAGIKAERSGRYAVAMRPSAAILLAAMAPAPASAATPADPGAGTYLLSIEGIALERNEYVDGFEIDTWGVEFVAICRFPPGWELRAARQASPDGVIAGQASHGVTFLDAARLRELQGLALVRLLEPVRWVQATGTLVPPTFAGHAGIGTYGTESRERAVPLGAGTIRLRPATACPSP